MENNAEIQIRPGDRLKECLKMAGLTQKNFATMVYMSKTQINNIVTGKSELTPENARLFASKLKITVDGRTDTVDPKYLLGQSEYMTMGNFFHDLSNHEEEKLNLFSSIMENYGYQLFQTVEALRDYDEEIANIVTTSSGYNIGEAIMSDGRTVHIIQKKRKEWEHYPLDGILEKYVIPHLDEMPEPERIAYSAAHARYIDAINPLVTEQVYVLVDIRSGAITFMPQSEAVQWFNDIDFQIRSILSRPFQKRIASNQTEALYNRKPHPQYIAK